MVAPNYNAFDPFTLEMKMREAGVKQTPMPNPGQMPPNQSAWTLQHWATFASIINLAQRQYNWTHDEALNDSRCNAQAMRRDVVIMDALRRRQEPVCQLEWKLTAADESNPELVANAEKLTRIVKRIPKFQQLRRTMLEAQWYGRYGAFLRYEWMNTTDGVMMNVADWYPVNGDKIVFRFDGTPGVLVNSAVYDGPMVPTSRGGMAHFLETPDELSSFIWHEFEPEDADFYDGMIAGSVHGYGFRGRIYWWWWLRMNLMNILMDFLQKVGMGIIVAFFESGNPQSQTEVANLIKSQLGNQVIMYPRNRNNQNAYDGPGIQHIPIRMEGAQLFSNMIEMLNEQMRSYILGEILTTQTAGTGMGSGVAEAHSETANRRTRYDAEDLQTPMQRLVDILNHWNFPGTHAPTFSFIVEKVNVGEYMAACNAAFDMGGDVVADEFYEKTGMMKPEPGQATWSKIQSMQPTAAMGTPQGVPMVGAPGPNDGSQGQQDQGQQQYQPFDPNAQSNYTMPSSNLPPAEPMPSQGVQSRMRRDPPWKNRFVMNGKH